MTLSLPKCLQCTISRYQRLVPSIKPRSLRALPLPHKYILFTIRFQAGDIARQHYVEDCLTYSTKVEDEWERYFRNRQVRYLQAALQVFRISKETSTEKRWVWCGSFKLEEFEGVAVTENAVNRQGKPELGIIEVTT